jgi:hypothetical protein
MAAPAEIPDTVIWPLGKEMKVKRSKKKASKFITGDIVR